MFRQPWPICCLLILLSAPGCVDLDAVSKGYDPDPFETVPAPIDLLLPRSIDIHPFTQTGRFDTGDAGIHARVQAKDAYGDATKAFGQFRFALHRFRPHHPTRRGSLVAQWEIDVSEPEQNVLHWDRHTRSYEFKLGGNPSMPPGRRFLLVATFASRFTPRLNAERELIVGE